MRIVFLRSNPVDPDPRVEKAVAALVYAGHEVEVLAWDRRGGAPRVEQRRGARIRRFSIKSDFGQGIRNLGPLLIWNLTVTRVLLREARGYDVIHACDFDCVWPAVVVRLLRRKPFVYDIFDFFSAGFYGSPARRLLAGVLRQLEFVAIRLAHTVIIVDDARREQIRGSAPRRLEVIYNAPEQIARPDAPTSDPQLKVLFAGVLYNNRGIKEMADVVAVHPSARLTIAGFGGDEDDIRAHVASMSNVEFIGKIDYSEVLRLSADSHVLFATYDPVVPNHRYSSANKLFEAMMLGKPIIVAQGTGMDVTVKQHGLGFVVPYGSRAALAESLNAVADWTEEDRQQFAERARSVYSAHFAWERMAERLRRIYTAFEREPAPHQ